MSDVDAMQFGDYIFQYNPQHISVSSAEHVVTHFCPGKTEVSQNLGQKARIAECSGSFFGETFADAMRELTRFRQKTADGKTAMLFLPGTEPFLARLTDFTFNAQGDGRVIPYTARFLEAKTG